MKFKIEGFSISNESRDHSKKLFNEELLQSLIWELFIFESPLVAPFLQIRQEKQIRAKRQTIFLFLSSPLNFYSRMGFLTEVKNTQIKSKTANKKVHSTYLITINQDAINLFFTIFIEATSIDHEPSSLH